MLSKIKIELIDSNGDYSIAHIEYKGYVDMLVDHNIDMVYDAIQAMVEDYEKKGQMERKVKWKDAVAEHEQFGPAHKH